MVPKQYNFFYKFIVRSPLLPFITLLNINKKKLKNIICDDAFKEAIYLASPLLYNEMQKWTEGKTTKLKETNKLQYSLLRYLIRMSTRCTPFGIFAGCIIGEIKNNDGFQFNDDSKIILGHKDKYSRSTRLDMNYLCELTHNLAKHPKIKEKLKYFPNTSIYQLGNKLRYVEYHYKNTLRIHQIVAVDNSEYLQLILNKARTGVHINDLVQLLVAKGINNVEARNFIDELLSSQILVSQMEPSITGDDLLEQILKVLDTINFNEDIKTKLDQANSELKSIDKTSIGYSIEKYKNIVSLAETMGTKYETQYLFQTDMVKPVIKCEISHKIANDVFKGIEILNKLTLKTTETIITQFRDAFYERYERQEVSLCIALDTESSIGYIQRSQDTGDITPLVDDVFIPKIDEDYNIKLTPIKSFLLSKYHQALKDNKTEIELTDEDLKPFKAEWDDLPETIAVMAQVYKDKIFISSAHGPCAATLLGRFCYTDNKIHDFVKEIIAKEEQNNPDVIFAEIVHLPESRTGNILFRPVLRKYEIPYLAKSSVAEEFQLNLNDLMISVKNGRIVLRSKKINKEIIPRLSSAHNYSYNALPIYQFLCDLQTQNSRGGVGFSWGVLASEFSFLPRVTYKNLIFSYATWMIKKDDIKSLLEIEDDETLIDQIREWRNKNKGSRLVNGVKKLRYLSIDNGYKSFKSCTNF